MEATSVKLNSLRIVMFIVMEATILTNNKTKVYKRRGIFHEVESLSPTMLLYMKYIYIIIHL